MLKQFSDPKLYPPKECAGCKKVFYCEDRPGARCNWKQQKYCVPSCRDKAHRGKNPRASRAGTKPKRRPPPASRVITHVPTSNPGVPLGVVLRKAIALHPVLGEMLSEASSSVGSVNMMSDFKTTMLG